MMSGVRAIVSAGIVGAVLWAFKREAERAQGQGADGKPVRLSNAPQRRNNLLNAAFSLFDDAGIGEVRRETTRRGGMLSIPRSGGSRGEPISIGQQLMSDLQQDFGLQRHQAAGIVGNLDHESAGFKSLQEIKPLVPGSRGGYGYAQWTGPRRRQFEKWVADRGLDARSYAANYGFLKHELTQTEEKRVLHRLRKTGSVEEAARVFSGSSQKGKSFDGFLRPGIPHMGSRIKRARRYA